MVSMTLLMAPQTTNSHLMNKAQGIKVPPINLKKIFSDQGRQFPLETLLSVEPLAMVSGAKDLHPDPDPIRTDVDHTINEITDLSTVINTPQ
ncbi:hypothetical protein AMTR_s00028p00246990 [Amborella trichopoda]|uniref:Uncharacterized protein n=1 Tax=Amborella trichopoda TaxID=13333 RepID=W1PSA3_AMBTC|nr:hypothetical protein AMTR_s00028p00246990 [Amborella trichopoda]